MTQNYTKRKRRKLTRIGKERRKLTRIARELYNKGVVDERKSAALYRRISKELREAGFNIQASALELLVETEELHKDILNEIIGDINEQIIMSIYKKSTTLSADSHLTFLARKGKQLYDPSGRIIKTDR